MDYYGFSKPLLEQYGSYLKNILNLDLGISIAYNRPVIEFVSERLKWTLLLMGFSLFISSSVGALMGAVSAYNRNNWWDKQMYYGMLLLSEVPVFIIGLIILFTFAINLQLFPLFGAYSYYTQYADKLTYIKDVAYHTVLPVFTLSVARVGGFYFLARNNVITVLSKDYIRTAKAKGVAKIQIITRHALRNAMLPFVTRIFMSIGGLISGTILVENVFAYPGLGVVMREAVSDRDYPLIQGLFLVVTILTLTANLLADITYKKLDPRIDQEY